MINTTAPMLKAACLQNPAFVRPRNNSLLRKTAAGEWWPEVQSIFGASIISRFATTCVCFAIFIISSSIQLLRGKLTLWGIFGGLALTVVLSAVAPNFIDEIFGFGTRGKRVGGCPGRFRPMLYFCSTTHARFSPTKHRFKYPLLYVGFPVTMKGTVGGGSLLSVKPSLSEMKKAENVGMSLKEWWTVFTVDPSKYLNPQLPFDEKLHDVLTGHVSALSVLT
jgi:hypothetical protein